jgi:hypothetical protein
MCSLSSESTKFFKRVVTQNLIFSRCLCCAVSVNSLAPFASAMQITSDVVFGTRVSARDSSRHVFQKSRLAFGRQVLNCVMCELADVCFGLCDNCQCRKRFSTTHTSLCEFTAGVH